MSLGYTNNDVYLKSITIEPVSNQAIAIFFILFGLFDIQVDYELSTFLYEFSIVIPSNVDVKRSFFFFFFLLQVLHVI